ASELADSLDVPSNRLHYHLDKLESIGLVANRKRKERGADGLYSYYVVTALGEAIMTHGVGELIAEERELLERYG
ncbi:MAG: transcriptional regulator, partial [Halobacteriales archaeon SW_9_67_24]